MKKIEIIERKLHKKYGCNCYYHYGESCYELIYESMCCFQERVNEFLATVNNLIDIKIEEDKATIIYEQ